MRPWKYIGTRSQYRPCSQDVATPLKWYLIRIILPNRVVMYLLVQFLLGWPSNIHYDICSVLHLYEGKCLNNIQKWYFIRSRIMLNKMKRLRYLMPKVKTDCWPFVQGHSDLTFQLVFYQHYDKTNKMICPSAQFDQSSLSAWRNLGSLATIWAHSKDSEQIGRTSHLFRASA